MAKITLKLNSKQLDNIKKKLNKLENELTSEDGPVFKYMLTIGNGYSEAVLSGMGKTTTGILTLKSFLGSTQSVNWKPLSPITRGRKAKNGWRLEIWMATGDTARAVKVFSKSERNSISVSAGIPSGSAEYEKALRVEFASDEGYVSIPGGRRYDGRALFTLLNTVFASNSKVIGKAIMKAVREAIVKINWGS